MTTLKINRKYNDKLFKFIFGNPKNRELALELYNGLNESNYNNPEDIDYHIVDDAIYMNIKNDKSFLVENDLRLWDQGDEYFPPIPLRSLNYVTKFYEDYIEKENLDIDGPELVMIPKLNCICLYDKKDNNVYIHKVKLSDIWSKDENSLDDRIYLELETCMININYEYNNKLLKRCKSLYEYSFFVDAMRSYIRELEKGGKNYKIKDVIDVAIDALPKDFKILNFLLENKEQITDICSRDYQYYKMQKAAQM